MLPLYPDIKPYQRHHLPVESPHELYLEESGNPQGIPVLFVHGGPGLGCSSDNRRFFDPEAYRIILFDQRGAGRSTPHAELQQNHTQALINDIEAIRHYLNVDRWILFGGSWGSTLSLLYAQAFPSRVLGLILRGIFLCRQEDLNWFYQKGTSRVFPDYWEDYIRHVPEARRDECINTYYELLTGDDELARMSAAKSWSLWEAHCATLRPNPHVQEQFVEPHTALALARIEAHYFVNQCFIEPNQILLNAEKLENIPGIIVHGRYDMICPLDNAIALHHAWYDSELHIIRDAGHSAAEPSIIDALVRATQEMAKRFGNDEDDAE